MSSTKANVTTDRANHSAALRMLVVSRRYWPCVDDSALRLMHWTEGLRTQGIESTIVTARYEAAWPDRLHFRNTHIQRLLPAPTTNWNESHFNRNVVQWLLKHGRNYDLIYCDRVDSLLSLLTTKGAKWPIPILARFSPFESKDGTYEPESVQQHFPMESTRRCDAIVTTSASAHRFLISQGTADSRIHRIVDPYWVRQERDRSKRATALHALGSINSDFMYPKAAKLIVHLGTSKWSQLKPALQNVCDLLDSGANLRFWIINCGIPYDIVYDYLKDRGWHREILLFDGFDDYDVFFQCSDLIWFSTPEDALQFSLPAAIACGVPVMLRDCPELRDYFGKSYTGVSYDSPTDLALNLHHWYANPETILSTFQQLRQDIFQFASPTIALQRFAAVCKQTIQAKQS